MTIHMHKLQSADPKPETIQYAAFAETQVPPSVDRALAKLMRVRADLADPDLKSSDAATAGMLASEEQALIELSTAPARRAEEFESKLVAFQAELSGEDVRRSTSLLVSSLITDFRQLMNTL